jgi:hypothetical protein
VLGRESTMMAQAQPVRFQELSRIVFPRNDYPVVSRFSAGSRYTVHGVALTQDIFGDNEVHRTALQLM